MDVLVGISCRWFGLGIFTFMVVAAMGTYLHEGNNCGYIGISRCTLNVVASLIVKPSLDRLPTTGKLPPDDARVACLLHVNIALAPASYGMLALF